LDEVKQLDRSRFMRRPELLVEKSAKHGVESCSSACSVIPLPAASGAAFKSPEMIARGVGVGPIY
jgi:hypothetical protein